MTKLAVPLRLSISAFWLLPLPLRLLSVSYTHLTLPTTPYV